MVAPDHWHLVFGTKDSRPMVDLLFPEKEPAIYHFVQFCDNMFHHDFDLTPVEAELRIKKYLDAHETVGFQMSSGDYAAICYPCDECRKESLN